MRKALEVIKKFANDEEGAALIEYTVLLAVLVVLTVATIGIVGTWAKTAWGFLCTTVSTTNAACVPPT